MELGARTALHEGSAAGTDLSAPRWSLSRRAALAGIGAGAITPLLAACGAAATGKSDTAGSAQLPKEPIQLAMLTWLAQDQVTLMQKAADVVKQKFPNIQTEIQSIPQAQMIVKPTTMA